MNASNSPAKIKILGPYSKVLTRGALGDVIDGRSRDGRFLRHTEDELVKQIGGEPTFAQRLLIRRVTKMMLLAEKLDEKLTNGSDWTPHDARTFGGLNNAIARALRDLGLKTQAKMKAPPSVADIAARHAKAHAE